MRLAKEAGMDNDVIQLSLVSSDRNAMLLSAQHFEAKGQAEKAVVLYSRSGLKTKAIELCFELKLFDQLKIIAEEVGENEDPEVLEKVAEFFLSHRQHDKAVQMLISAKH